MLTESKALLRRELLRRRSEMPDTERREIERALCGHLSRELETLSPDLVLLYAAVRGELDIFSLAETILSKKIAIAYPRSERGGVMRFHTVGSPSELVTGLYAIPEPPQSAPSAAPSARSVCIVPALAYDRDGYRLGYGGGYYDRFLKGFPGKTIGVAPAYAIYGELPRDENDLPVSMIATERGILSLSPAF